MRITVIFFALMPLMALPAAAQIRCASVSTTVSIGKVSARPAVKTFMSVIPVSCLNTGGTPAREVVSVFINEPTPVLLTTDDGGALPVQIAFRAGAGELATSLCREVELGGGERASFDVPITVRIRVASPHHGHYQTAIPVIATTVADQPGATGSCH